MSTFISFAFPHQPAYLITDGAVWDAADQTLAFVRCKAFRAKRAPIAVTGRGELSVVEEIANEICNRADVLGTAATISGLQAFAQTLQERAGTEDKDGAHFLISAYVDGKGAVARSFSTHQRDRRLATGEDIIKRAPFEVWDPGMVYWSGTPVRAEEVEQAGLYPRPNEPLPAFIRRSGLGIMEMMRTRPGKGANGEPIWCVGGHVDLTTIDARGARTERLCTWPDVIGEPIDPTRRAA